MSAPDQELEAIRDALVALLDLDQDARKRALRCLESRLIKAEPRQPSFADLVRSPMSPGDPIPIPTAWGTPSSRLPAFS